MGNFAENLNLGNRFRPPLDPYNLTSNLIYMKGHLNYFKFWPHWPLRNPYREGAKSSEILSKYFLTYNDFKTTNNSFSSKWHLSTFFTTVLTFSPNRSPVPYTESENNAVTGRKTHFEKMCVKI